MRNRPFHELTRPGRTSGPFIDHSPHIRLWSLFVLFVSLAGVVVWRLYGIQSTLAQRYIAAWERTTETLETLPARDGRILTADGQILAYDLPRFDIALHYRWLEEPPDSAWLDSQARQLLPPGDRRNPERLKQAREQVLAQRDAVHAAIARVSGHSLAELRSNFQRVQSRVERIYVTVEQRLTARQDASSADSDPLPDSDWAERAWNALTTELTTPPQRTQHGPLVIQEQLDSHVVLEDVPLNAVTAIESSPGRFPGVEVRRSSRRLYPAGKLAAHIVGARTEINGDELKQRVEQFPQADPQTYDVGDRIGRSGIERAYEATLRGRKGLRRVVRDRRGQLVRTDFLRQPEDGRDVVLSFDSGLQARAEALLDAALDPPSKSPRDGGTTLEQLDAPPAPAPPQGGCIVAIDVRNGRVLTAAAAPRFDANLIVDHDPVAWNAAVSDPRQPFFPRVTQMTIPPGSVFKALTALALIESGLIDPDASFDCQGYLDEPDRNRCLIYRHYGAGHGDVTLDDALCRSCNVYFFDAARRVGPQPIHDWAARFGLGRRTGADFPGERAGQLPDPRDKQSPWYSGTTLQLAIGQASLAVTPLQVARMMAAIANDGYLVTPTFVRPEAGSDNSAQRAIQQASYEFRARPVRQRIPGLSPGTLARIRTGLRMVVEDPHGTGKRVRLDHVSIAGKTGTAEVGGGKPDHAWFAGYVPADEPRVAFVVVLEHGGSGGHVAGPLAHDFVQALLATGVVRPDR